MKNLLKGSVVALAAVATFAGSAFALTAADIDLLVLLGIVPADKAAAAKAAIGSTSSVMFSSDLKMGDNNASVQKLQQYLNSKGFTVAATGAGSPGKESTYFGGLTKNALSVYQAAKGLSVTGWLDAATRSYINSDGNSNVPSNPGNQSNSGDGREGQLVEIDNTSTDVESDLDEGEEDVYVFGAELEAEDSDMTIERVDVDFTLVDASTGSDDIEDYFTEVSLFLGDKKLASLDVDEADENDAGEGDFSTAANENDVYSFRFTGLNGMIEEGDTAVLYVAVTADDNLDSDDLDEEWAVLIPDDGIRAVDEAGISETYVGSSDLTEEEFSVSGVDAGDLDLSIDSGDNEDRVVQLDADNDTDDVEVLAFTLESEASDNVVDEIEIDLATTTSTTTLFSTVVKRAHLYADGDKIGSESVDDNATTGATILFDNLDFEINEDDEVEFTVTFDFNDDADQREGYTFAATVDASQIDAEDGEGDDVTVTGDVTGGDIELRTTGVSAKFVSSSATKAFEADASGEQDVGTFKITFDVTAFEEDIYLDRTVTRDDSTAGGSAGEGFMWATTSDSTVGTTSLSASISAQNSDSSDSTGIYKIDKGETRRFTLSVDLDASDIDGYAALMLTAINWTTDSGDSTPDNFYTTNLDDFKTDNLSLYTF